MTTRPSARRRTIDARLGLTRGGTPQEQARLVTMPPLVGTLIVVMVGVFVMGLPSRTFGNEIDWTLGFVPYRFAAGLLGEASLAATLVPLFGHVFVHGNLPHLLLNVLWLAVFGTGVARRMAIEDERGAWRNGLLFVAFFMASGVAGALAYGVLNPGAGHLLVGASGAISGLMAAAMRFALRPFAPYGPAHGPLASPHARPVAVASAVYIGFNLLTALGAGGLFGSGLQIAWEAHIGGYLFGLYAFPAFDRLVKRPAPPDLYGA
jgi:membrane associated rhomboid family serine protease